MAVACGLFALGLVLGWSALFLRGSTWLTRSVQFLWLAALVLLAAFSPDPISAAAGAATGALAHLMFQLGLEGRHA